jgi:hypothetical protein
VNPSPGLESFYDLLGVSRDASRAQIRAAFLQRAQECHPDLNGQDEAAEVRFREIRFAYEVLHDKRKRAEYDHNPSRFHRQKQRSEWRRTATSTERTSARWEPSPHRFRATRSYSTRTLATVLGGILAVFAVVAAAVVTIALEADHRKLLDFAHIRLASEADLASPSLDSGIPDRELSVDSTALGPIRLDDMSLRVDDVPIRVDDMVVAWRGSTSLNQLVAPVNDTAPPLESVSAAQSAAPLTHGGDRTKLAEDQFGNQADAFLPRVQHTLWTGPGDSSRSIDQAGSPLFFNPPATPAPLSPQESGASVMASTVPRMPMPTADEWTAPVLSMNPSSIPPADADQDGGLERMPVWKSPIAWRETRTGVDWSHPLMAIPPTGSIEDRLTTPLIVLPSIVELATSGSLPGSAGIGDVAASFSLPLGPLPHLPRDLVSNLPGIFLPSPWSLGTPMAGDSTGPAWTGSLPTFENLWRRPSLASLGRIAGDASRPALRVPSNLPSSVLTLNRLSLTGSPASPADGSAAESAITDQTPATFSRLRTTTPPLGSTLRLPTRQQQDYSGVASRSMVRETPPGAAWINLRPTLPRAGGSLSTAGSLTPGSDTTINPTTGLAGVGPSQPPRGLTHPGKWPPQPAQVGPARTTPGGSITPGLRYSPTISSSSIYPPLYSF